MDIEKIAAMRPERMEVRARLDAYLTGTLEALAWDKWRSEGVYLGLDGGNDRIVANGFIQSHEGTEYELRLTLTVGRETEYVIEMVGQFDQVHRSLAPGVPTPTIEEALEAFFQEISTYPDDK